MRNCPDREESVWNLVRMRNTYENSTKMGRLTSFKDTMCSYRSCPRSRLKRLCSGASRHTAAGVGCTGLRSGRGTGPADTCGNTASHRSRPGSPSRHHSATLSAHTDRSYSWTQTDCILKSHRQLFSALQQHQSVKSPIIILVKISCTKKQPFFMPIHFFKLLFEYYSLTGWFWYCTFKTRHRVKIWSNRYRHANFILLFYNQILN